MMMNKGQMARLIMALGLMATLAVEAAKQRPNIIFIMADDMGYGDPRCYNPESKIPTPNMDLLAKQGMLFTDAHTSASVCTPSRYGVLTGRYCWRTRLKSQVLWTTFDEPLIEKERMTVGRLAQQHGYATACIGKWHLGIDFYRNNSDEFARGKRHHHNGSEGCRDVDFSRPAAYSPNDLGFDYSFISGAGHNMEPHCFIKNREPAALPTEWREADSPTTPGASALESHEGWMSPGWSDEEVDREFSRQAVSFIQRTRKKDPEQPFFIYLTPVSPHRPCVPTDDVKGTTGVGLREDFVMEFDRVVGEVVEMVDALGISENTLIMVTSDNGAIGGGKGHRSNGKLAGRKASLLEGGHRVPFIVRWPKAIDAGSINEDPMCLSGLLATMAEMFGEELPADAGEDSVSFLPSLYGMSNKAHETVGIVHHDYSGGFALRLGDWKLIPEKKMLFNLRVDPSEKNNLYDQNPERVERLSQTLGKYKTTKRSR